MRLFFVTLNPFHLLGTLIYREPDGEWIYWCRHCGRNRVPAHILRTLVLVPIWPDLMLDRQR